MVLPSSANSDCGVHGLPPEVEVFFDEELASIMDNQQESDEEDDGINVEKVLDAAVDAPDAEDEQVTRIFKQVVATPPMATLRYATWFLRDSLPNAHDHSVFTCHWM
ncbi:hypothetical protein CYMTET_12852 [Cymbomonas tetramitiformis]|uniref:Uncharacterized protein n=1 Tax=Cymbomonas tetramitiformis TaxID=36881 RepID=A0AAE0LC11_9CHLO|nr:hypothetical protein CYMTET_12852 [Cymbomonas tetramitiformis]